MNTIMNLIQISGSTLTIIKYNSSTGTITDPLVNVTNPAPTILTVNTSAVYSRLFEVPVPNILNTTKKVTSFILLENKHPLAIVDFENLDTNSTDYSASMDTYYASVKDKVGTDTGSTSGGGGGASILNDLTDVTLTSPSNDQFLRYDGSKWINETVSISGGGSGNDYTTAGLATTAYVDNADTTLQNQIDGLDIKDYTTAGLASITYVDNADTILQNQIDTLDIKDYTTAGLASTSDLADYLPLAGGTMTGDVIMTEGEDVVFKYSGFNNNINTDPLTSNRRITFPDLNGTVALTSQLGGGSGSDYTTAGLVYQIDFDNATSGINTSLDALDTRVTTLEASTSGAGGSGAFIQAIVSPSSPYAPTNGNVILWDTTSGNKIINLPPASSSFNFVMNIKKIDNSGNTITVNGNGSETIDGGLTAILTTQYESITIVCDGSNWYIT